MSFLSHAATQHMPCSAHHGHHHGHHHQGNHDLQCKSSAIDGQCTPGCNRCVKDAHIGAIRHATCRQPGSGLPPAYRDGGQSLDLTWCAVLPLPLRVSAGVRAARTMCKSFLRAPRARGRRGKHQHAKRLMCARSGLRGSGGVSRHVPDSDPERVVIRIVVCCACQSA